MTVENKKIIYKIEVSGIESYTQELPSTITSNFVLNEIVTGTTSGATAVVDKATLLTDTEIRIRTKSGFFIENESLTGSVSGVATKIGSTEVTNAPYENTDFDIVNGTWTLYSDADILTKMNDPIEKINISKGGNLASGYSFGFEVTNFEFAKALQRDGVFFRNRKCVLFMGVVDGVITYTDQWTGSIESFTDVDEDTVSFKCGDLTKQNVKNIGSEKVPIAINKNYNCKLVLEGKKDDNFNYIEMGSNENVGYITIISMDKNGSSIRVSQSQAIQDLIDANEFNNIIVEVVFGAGLGNTYNVVSAENFNPSHKLFLDNEDISELEVSNDVRNFDTTIIVLKKFNFTYNLSQNQVSKIHTENNSNVELPIRVEENEIDYFVSTSSYEVEDNKKILINDILNEDSMKFSSSLDDLSFDRWGSGEGGGDGGGLIRFRVYYSNDSLAKIIDFQNKNEELFYRPVSIKIPNAIISESDPSFDPLNFNTTDMITFIETTQILSKKIGIRTIETSFNNKAIYLLDQKVTIETKVTIGSLANHYDLEITTPNWNSFKSIFTVDQTVNYSEAADTFYHEFRISLKELPSTQDSPDLTRWTDETKEVDNYIMSFSYEGERLLSIDNVSIGCNGENVQSAQGIVDGFENVPDTIEYLLTDHYGKELTDINLPSFTEAQDNFGLFINDPVRNAAHQIVDQTDGNQLLKDILFDHHLGMFINHKGEYYLENWLPKSIVFGFKEADTAYNETNTIDIKPIKRDTLNNVVSDYQFKMDLSEATGDHNRTLRVKNPNEATFDFARDIEGVDASDEALAFSAWQLAKAGYNRITNLTQTEQESNWHKLAFSDGTGTSEGIAFIRNQLAHVNREHEYIIFTVPYNETNLSKELLSFISIEDAKITDGEARNGWIVERRLNLKNDTITWKMLLDISKYDPFLFQVNVWKDGNFVLNIKTDGNFPNNIKTNGTGI